MSPHRLSAAVPTHSVPGSRGKEKSKVENLATAAQAEEQVKKQEKKQRADVLRNIKTRYARHCECPTSIEESSIAQVARFPPKRSPYPAHDDTYRKRRKMENCSPRPLLVETTPPGKKNARRKETWDKEPSVEQHTSPYGMLAGSSLAIWNKGGEMGSLGGLPTEIRDEILRYILLWPKEIVVFHGWSYVYPRRRPHLELSILSTCQTLRTEGLRILFGENTFTYHLRNPKRSHKDTKPVIDGVFRHCEVPINEYGHLMRHVKVKVEGNRLGNSDVRGDFERAVFKFLGGHGLKRPATLRTLTFEIPAVRGSDPSSHPQDMRQNHVPICDYLRKDSKVGQALLQLQIQWVYILAQDGEGDWWNSTIDLRYLFKDKQMMIEYTKLNKVKKQKSRNHMGDGNSPIVRVERPLYRPKDVKAMEDHWDCQVARAIAKLHNLSWRIEGLVLDPDCAVGKLGLWRPVSTF
ncbi:hypothetical protein GGS20DRAFT_386626 [Poronia punctata]|nr:hypothetical protein GGS20DRAFT_386626 [Poronia punctata]